MKYLLIAALSCFSCLAMSQAHLYDPLRGISIDDLVRDGPSIYSLRIDAAKRGSGSDFCDYLYIASIRSVYRGALRVGSKVSFVSSERLPVDTDILVVPNKKSRGLNPTVQDQCLKQVRKEDPGIFLVRKDEFVFLYYKSEEEFIFLPFRHFWSIHEPVIEREFVKTNNLKYQFLLYTDGQLEGRFYGLRDILTGSKDSKVGGNQS